MACINKNTQGRVISVENNQNQPSQLYADALALTGDETQAIEIWSVAYSPEYQEVNGITEIEPTLENVLVFMQRSNNQAKKLSNNDIDAIRNNTLSVPFSFLEELHTQIQELYPNGVFTINEVTLKKSGLYTSPERQMILNDESVQDMIKSSADKIIAEVSLNDSNLNEINSQMALYETPELSVVYDTENVIGLGKFQQLNPFLIDKELRQKVGGIKNREQFEQALRTANEAIVERYNANPVYANKLFDAYSEMDRMLMLEDDLEGGLSYVVQNNIKAFTEQSLVVGQEATDLKNILGLLLSTPRIVWANSGVEIEDMLLRAEDYASDLGIDIIGMSEQEYSYDEAMSFLNSLSILVNAAEINAVQETDLQNFYDNYNIIFSQNLQPVFTAREMNPNNRGRTLTVVDSNKSEQELFDQNSLIKANDEGVYHRVSRQQDIEQLYDYTVDLIQFNPNIIDKKALYPSTYTQSGNFSYQKATDPANREQIREDLIRYTQQQTLSEELILYKIAFGHPLTFPAPQKSLQAEYTRYKTVKEDFNYLTTDFISDFARIYLQEKLKDSELFKKVLTHFAFNERGIVLKDTDLYSRQEIQLFTPEKGTLAKIKQYAAISKDPQLNSLYSIEPSLEVIPEDFKRQFYINNPSQLDEKAIQYELSEDEEFLATQNLKDNYINIKGDIWEKAREYKNITVYQRLPVNTNPDFSNYQIEVNIDTKVNVEQFQELVQTIDNVLNIEKVYSKKELEQINREKECN